MQLLLGEEQVGVKLTLPIANLPPAGIIQLPDMLCHGGSYTINRQCSQRASLLHGRLRRNFHYAHLHLCTHQQGGPARCASILSRIYTSPSLDLTNPDLSAGHTLYLETTRVSQKQSVLLLQQDAI